MLKNALRFVLVGAAAIVLVTPSASAGESFPSSASMASGPYTASEQFGVLAGVPADALSPGEMAAAQGSGFLTTGGLYGPWSSTNTGNGFWGTDTENQIVRR